MPLELILESVQMSSDPSRREISGFGRCSCCGKSLNEANLDILNEFICLYCARKLFEGFLDIDKEEVENDYETEDD